MVSYQPSEQGNKQEYEDETTVYEKHHAPGGYQFSHRHRRQYRGGVWIRSSDRKLALRVFGSTRPLPPYYPVLCYILVGFPPYSSGLKPGYFLIRAAPEAGTLAQQASARWI